jgi:hypothetical protein
VRSRTSPRRSSRSTHIFIDQGYVDARISYPIAATDSEFSIRTTAGPELGEALKLAVRYLPASATAGRWCSRALQGQVACNPTGCARRAASSGSGVEHILTGYDHLLFLLCLIVPLRGWRPGAVGRHRLHAGPLV